MIFLEIGFINIVRLVKILQHVFVGKLRISSSAKRYVQDGSWKLTWFSRTLYLSILQIMTFFDKKK